jgi:hypothetical protein
MRTLPFAAFTVAALAVALAGCSSGGATASGPATTSSAGTTGAAAPAAPTATHVAATGPITPDRLCALVPVKEAAAALNTTPAITQQQSGSFVHGEPECAYGSADRSVVVNVTIFDPAQTKFTMTHGVMSDAALSPVSGLGKSAAYGGPEVDVLYGTKGLVVESFGDTAANRDQILALAKLELSRLS